MGPMQSSDGLLATSKEEITEELRKTFFLGQFLTGRSFDEDHYVEVTRRVPNQDLHISTEHDERFHEDFSIYEIESAVKDLPQLDVFDNDGVYASMLNHFGIRVKLRLLKLFISNNLQKETKQIKLCMQLQLQTTHLIQSCWKNIRKNDKHKFAHFLNVL